MGYTLFRDPQARSSALAVLGTLQPRAFRSLNRIDPLDSVSDYYLENLLYVISIKMLNILSPLVIVLALRLDSIIHNPLLLVGTRATELTSDVKN